MRRALFAAWLVLAAAAAHAGPVLWIGGPVGDWNNPGNWSSSLVPGPSDDVTIPTAFVVAYGTNPAPSANSLTLQSGAVLDTFAGASVAGALSLQTGAALQFGATAPFTVGTFALAAGSSATYNAPPVQTGTVPPLHLQAALFALSAGSTVTVLGGGYAPGAASPGFGPGAGGGDGAGDGGAGGGGAGAGGFGFGGTSGGAAYGSMPPADGGSGGGGATTSVGGAGGGFLIVDATTAALDGFLQADGAAGGSQGAAGGGGGGGGTILVRAQVLTGAGAISAVGGNGGAGASAGGGGGGGGRAWLKESGAFNVVHATLTVTTAGGAAGGAGFGGPGGAGAAIVDPRHWTAAGPDALASDAANWNDGLAPSGGERLVFGSSATSLGCAWDLGGVFVGSAAVTTAFSTSVTLGAPMNVTGSFAMAGGTFTSVPGLSLGVGGALAQTGGRLDIAGSGLVLGAIAGSVPASFYDARASSLTVGQGVVAATVTFTGRLEVLNQAALSLSSTLSLSTGTLILDGGGPFAGLGSVNAASTGSVLDAGGSSTQTWTTWPGVIGGLRSSNASGGGLTLSAAGGTRFTIQGGVFVDTGAVLIAPGTRLDVGGDWVSYGTTTLSGSTVSFRAVSGVQSVLAGGLSFDNLVVNDAGATLRFSTYVVVADSVGVFAGTLDLAGSTLQVRGNWTEVPGATVLGGTSQTTFNSLSPQTVYQLGGNTFGTFIAASAAGVSISSTITTLSSFLWESGSLAMPNVRAVVGGDLRKLGGAGLNVAGSTEIFNGASTQTVTFNALGDFVDQNASAAGVRLGANMIVASFLAPGVVVDGQNAAVTVDGPVWNTTGATYYAQNPAHAVLWAPPAASSITIAAGSVVNAQLTVGAHAVAVLQGDLNLVGTGTALIPGFASTISVPPGGSTIAFRGSSDLLPASGANWFFNGDVADSWLVFEGPSGGRGAAISTTTFGTLRVTLNTSTDVFTAPNLNLLGRLIVESGTVRPAANATLAVDGDVLQNGGVVDFGTFSTGTLRLNGPSAQTLKMLYGEHALWNLTDASTSPVQAASSMTIRGDFVVSTGTFLAGSGTLNVSGRVYVSSAGVFSGQSSTVTLNGAANGLTSQTLAVYGAAAFNGLSVNVLTASLLTSATAATFTDAFPGGTLAVQPGTQLTAADLFLGPASGANLSAQSIVPGSAWYLKATALSSATLTTASDSNASPGLPIVANDGRCVNGGGDVNWDFSPQLLVLLPGETFTPGIAPGKTGAPTISTAGASEIVSVLAMSSSFGPAYAATGTVVLASDDPYASVGGTQALVNGATSFSFTPFVAEPSPRTTRVTAAAFFGSGLSTATVVPAGLTRLQIVLPGESPIPGSPTGRGGAPYPRAKSIPFAASVRAVDPFWNLVDTVTDSVGFTDSASTATLPAPLALTAGQLSETPIVFYATGTFTLSVTDLTEPSVLSSTSTPFTVSPPSASSPTAAFYVPTGAAVTTLGGAIAGTAADGSSVARVRVDILDIDTNLHYDGGPRTFSALAPIFATTTLAAPLAASTSWSNLVPDAALSNGQHYLATALVDDPTGFESVTASTFTVDRSALTFGSGNGQGLATVLPSAAPGCEARIATVTFTVGAAGITPGGAVAVQVPPGWTPPVGVTAQNPPPAGYWNMTSTSVAVAVGTITVAVAPASYGAQPLGPGWLLLSVGTTSTIGFHSGENIFFTYAGLPPLSPAGRGPQTFGVWSQAAAGGALAAISTQPAMTLLPGTTSALTFSDETTLSLGPLQNSATMELQVVDLCGNPAPGASSGTVSLSFVVPEAGVYVPDASAVFTNIHGSPISYVSLTTGTAQSIGFTVYTATSGPTLAYIQATSSFTAAASPIAVSAVRPVRLTVSSETFTAVSVDTGTLSPGTTSAALAGSVPSASLGRLAFTLGDPALAWTAALSLDGVNFSSPTFLASGYGNASTPIVLTWDGVDRVSVPPRYAPPGHYHALLSAGGGASRNTAVEIVVPRTSGYTGNLGAAGASAYVRAVGPGAGDGAFAQASSTGYFLLTGLDAGQSYQVTAATAAAIGALPVTLSTALAAPAAGIPAVNLGSIALPAPAPLAVAVILPVPAPFDEVGGFVGLNPDGSVAFSGPLHFSTGSASSDDGGPLFGRAASTESVVLAAPGVYTVQIEFPDLNLSTSVAGVTLAPGGTDLIVPMSKSANVFGWAVLPSTAPGGTEITVSATKAGASAPGAFGGVFVSSVPPAVGQSSGAYALYGLSPGTWTVLASAPGFLSTSSYVVILSSADAAGPTLPLGVGGTIVGTITVTGNSLGATQCFAGAGGAPGVCAPGTFDVPLTATALGAPGTASAGAVLGVSASFSSATFAITGLPPGLWTLTSSLPGFTLSPAGGLVVSVAGASVSTSALTLAAQDARLNVTVLLAPPAGGGCWPGSTWKSLGLEFNCADGAARTFGDATALTGPGSFESLNCSSATFFTPALPPGPVRAGALFAGTGAWAYGRALLASGATAALTLDLSASSVAAIGTLSVSGLIGIGTTTAAGAPYTVLASSPAGVLSAASGVSFCLLGSRNPDSMQALRAELIPYDAVSGEPALRVSTGGAAGLCAAPAASTSAATSLGFATPVSPNGAFSFAPGVAPGNYLFRVPGELDGNAADGPEAVEFDQLVTIGANGIVLAPTLGRGFSVSGALTAPANLPSGRQFSVSLIGAGGAVLQSAVVAPAPGGAAAFAFNGVGNGAYALTASDLGVPAAFSARPQAATVAGASASGAVLALGPSGTLYAHLAVLQPASGGVSSPVLITPQNAGLLPPGFAAVATADPAQPGATYASLPAVGGALVDSSGRLAVTGLAPGTYDVLFSAPSGTLASAKVSGISVAAGQAVDMGVVSLFSGASVTGKVVDAATGLPIANLTVSGVPSASGGSASPAAAAPATATTDASGRYVLAGLDPTQSAYDLTAAPRGSLSAGQPLAPYAAQRTLSVSVASGAVANFALQPAAATIAGKVVSGNGAALTAALPGQAAAPGAVVYLQTAGLAPAADPLADLALHTNPDGTFAIPAVATGSYRLTAQAQGQGTAVIAVIVSSSFTSVGSVTLGSGGTVSGAVRLPDGSSPSVAEVLGMAAIASDSSDFQFAALTLDPTGRSVVGYAVGGLTPGKTYRLVVSGPGGSGYVPPAAASLVLASSSTALTINLNLQPPSGPVTFRATRAGAVWNLTTVFPRPLRALTAADSNPQLLLTTAPATGALSGGALAADRQTLTATYAPGPSETTSVFLASGTLAATNWASTNPSAAQLTISATASLQLVGDGLTRQTVVNGLGGTLTFDGDAGRVVLPRGAFGVDASSPVAVSFSRSATPAAYAALALPPTAASDLYDVSLPAGFPTGLTSPATLSLAYSTSVADPSTLNVYWYNPGSRTYVLQPDVLGAAPVVDRVARTVTVRVNHFSTYVLLNSAAGAIGGSPFSGGGLNAYNFPNPFDLSYRTVTTIHGGGSPTIRGTMISVSVPPGLSGEGTVKVFDITGRLLRTMDMGSLSAGETYYQNWDGRNDFGRDVASGLYLCEVDVGSQRKIFKMAVLK